MNLFLDQVTTAFALTLSFCLIPNIILSLWLTPLWLRLMQTSRDRVDQDLENPPKRSILARVFNFTVIYFMIVILLSVIAFGLILAFQIISM